MAYRDFDVKKVINVLGYKVLNQRFIDNVQPEEPSADLRAALKLLGSAVVLNSEKARSEAVVAPVLSEAANKTGTCLFSGEIFDVDQKLGLNGVADFLFTRQAPGKTIIDPVLCIVEAKKADINSRAFGQCMATMIAAQKYNQHKGPLFGCVTTGREWQFIRLDENLIQINPEVYFEDRLEIVLGIFISLLRAASPSGNSPAG